MANTTNYNWETPDDTDLVKDGAAAIRTLGSAIDTTTKALNPSTTLGDIEYRSSTANTNTRLAIGSNGQILGVSGGVPAWINNDQGDITEVQAGTGISIASGTGPIPVVTNTVATEFDAKGDLVVGTGADTFDKLSVGTDNQRLVAASGETTGLKYVSDTQNTIIDAEGDLLVGDSADTLQRLAIGSNGHILTVDTSVDGKIKWAAAAGSGKVLQVVSANITSQASIASTSYTDSNITATITPTLNTSKILVIISANTELFSTSNTANTQAQLLRGATQIQEWNSFTFTQAGSGSMRWMGSVAITYLDSPATTSATTYKIQGKVADTANSQRIRFQNDSTQPSQITLLEIGV